MVKINYFKSPKLGDCYVSRGYVEGISISKKECRALHGAEIIFNGAYKEISIAETTFKKMVEYAKKNERKELTNLLKLTHEKNRLLLNNLENPVIKVKTNFLNGIGRLNQSNYLRSYFFNAKPILE